MRNTKQIFLVLSPDGINIEPRNYKTKAEAQRALENWVKGYEMQGYYSTICEGERFRIPYNEIVNYCTLKTI